MQQFSNVSQYNTTITSSLRYSINDNTGIVKHSPFLVCQTQFNFPPTNMTVVCFNFF